MHRIDSANNLLVLPAKKPAINAGGYFNNDPTGSPGTVLDPDWLNSLQEEMAAVLAAAGIAMDRNDDTQLLASIRALIAGAPRGVALITVPGNFVVPAGVFLVDAEAWGGGGSGGPASVGFNSAGAGGGCGGYARKLIAVTPGDIIACTIGVGGPINSNPGGTTSFGTFFSATGGTGGVINGAGGVSGNGVGGLLNLTGAGGGNTLSISGGMFPGDGGAAPFGGGGGPAERPGAMPGGGGGGGSQTNVNGQAGGAGAIRVRW